MRTIAYRDAINEAIAEEMERDESIFIMGEEVAEYDGAYKVTRGLLERFGSKRVIDSPISENGFVGLGIGAASVGLRPIIEVMTWNFAFVAFDQIINNAAKLRYMSGGQIKVPLVIRGPGGPANWLAAQHSHAVEAFYAHIPGLVVVQPSTPYLAKGLLKAAIRDPNPVVFLENEVLYGQSFEVPDVEDWVVPIGKAKILREGSDVTIVSFSRPLQHALEAADALAEEGIRAEVIDLRTIRPLDTETIINSVKKTNRIVSLEEGWPQSGIGSEIAALVMEQAFDHLDAPLVRVTGKDVPMPYAANLERMALPQTRDVVEAAKAVCYRT